MPGRTKKDVEATEEDASMQDVNEEVIDNNDAEMQEENEAVEEEEEEIEQQRVKILPGSTDQAASFEFVDEGHTLGNALRYIIMKNPDVEFCAYAIPHPSEAKMNVRIQTYEGTAVDALKKGLSDLQSICDVVEDEFTTKKDQYNAENGIQR
ncbi:hypothetical protein Golomagni_06403 [Golovinomyces magnicellulatus]|nr:hypothetical protein Golomagni_06403 [Golovinomyces magnicellulatus]